MHNSHREYPTSQFHGLAVYTAEEEQVFVSGTHLLFDMKDFANMALSIFRKLKTCNSAVNSQFSQII